MLVGALALWGSCGARPGYPIIEVGDAPGHVSRCGFVVTYGVAPLTTSVGGQVALTAAARTTDGGAVDATLAWQSPRGRIDAGAPDTTFTCLVGGQQAINLVARTPKCADVLTFAVTCVAPQCGNGHLESGEQCDPPNGTTCLAGCALPCGNGLIDGNEQCDPPDGTTCSPACTKLPNR